MPTSASAARSATPSRLPTMTRHWSPSRPPTPVPRNRETTGSSPSRSPIRAIPTRSISYTVSGDATPGSDYTTLTGSVTILANATTAVIDVTRARRESAGRQRDGHRHPDSNHFWRRQHQPGRPRSATPSRLPITTRRSSRSRPPTPAPPNRQTTASSPSRSPIPVIPTR